jgi:hypothetical protein
MCNAIAVAASMQRKDQMVLTRVFPALRRAIVQESKTRTRSMGKRVSKSEVAVGRLAKSFRIKVA